MKSSRKVAVEFGLVAMAHNLRKYAAILSNRPKGKTAMAGNVTLVA